MNIRILAILFLSSFILVSCDSRVIFEDNIRIPENRWYQDNIIRLQAEIPDTVTPLNLYINVRNASGYQFSNLFLFMNTITPDSMIARDTVEIQLADESGRWMGDGMGDIWDNRILFKKNFRFPVAGTYTFELQQAMRVNPLPQIMDAGIRIERAE
ncbi:MAG: gliding motility lipoprotein GldH [Bacteroidetes bacterium]|nr:MAG: gliding motility lipoprotein GldH [Bacteroidota bacterium]REK31938.1 MAG: gliding motility lipoprotein GldH [Bacteroidota bacterium]REK50004.1 MAG: gliding motility lipoprotein GldH [Bacteroidota bacterium]